MYLLCVTTVSIDTVLADAYSGSGKRKTLQLSPEARGGDGQTNSVADLQNQSYLSKLVFLGLH